MAKQLSTRFQSIPGGFQRPLFLLTFCCACALRSEAFGDAATVVATPSFEKALSKSGTSTVPTRESLQLAAPQEREPRTPGSREKRGLKARPPLTLTPMEREQRRVEIHQRLTRRMEALRQKQKATGLNPEEEKQLRRLEGLSKGFQPADKKDASEPVAEKPVEKGVPTLHKANPTSPQ